MKLIWVLILAAAMIAAAGSGFERSAEAEKQLDALIKALGPQ